MATRVLLGLLIVVIGGAVAAGLVVLGWPATQRELRLDDRRAQDLDAIVNQVHIYRLKHKTMPESLPAMFAEAPWMAMPQDPVTAAVYEYRVVDHERYEVCAFFQRQSETRAHRWPHGAGRTCFTRRVARD